MYCSGDCLLSRKLREEALLNAMIRDMQALWQLNVLQWPWDKNLGFISCFCHDLEVAVMQLVHSDGVNHDELTNTDKT